MATLIRSPAKKSQEILEDFLVSSVPTPFPSGAVQQVLSRNDVLDGLAEATEEPVQAGPSRRHSNMKQESAPSEALVSCVMSLFTRS